jgi:hypothetical protein
LEKLIDYTLVHYKFVAYSLLFRPWWFWEHGCNHTDYNQ